MSSVCPSVRLSVTLVDCDHIDWKSWKLTARTISPTPSLFVAKRRSTYSEGPVRGTWGIFGRLEVGREKVACWRTKVAISLKCVKIEEKLLWRAYIELTNALSNGTNYHSRRPPLPQIGCLQPHSKLQSKIAGKRVNSACPVVAAQAWNALPDYVTSAPTYIGLRYRTSLKTYLFSRTF